MLIKITFFNASGLLHIVSSTATVDGLAHAMNFSDENLTKVCNIQWKTHKDSN